MILVSLLFPYSRARWRSLFWRMPIGMFAKPAISRSWGRFNAGYWRRDLAGFANWYGDRRSVTELARQ